MENSHRALWVGGRGELSIRQQPSPTAASLSAKQYIVRVIYSGVNPADQKHAMVLGLGDRVAGYDAAGIIVATGAETSLKKGRRVCVLAKTGIVEHAERYGCHQEFLVAEEAGCFPVPERVPMHIAATMPVVVATAADCLFSLLRLEPERSEANRVPVLIWGGSSAVGNAALQLAREAGTWPIIVTASPRHHPELMRRGATACVDYKDERVLDKILAIVQELAPGKALRHAVDAVGHNARDIQELCGGEPDSALACTVGGAHGLPKPFAAVVHGCDIALGHGLRIPARTQDAAVVRDKVLWALNHSGCGFEQVPVTIVQGLDEVQKCVEKCAQGSISFGKYVTCLSPSSTQM
ncbi:hypothetical protein E4U49_005190 [Claviceps purpurea]|nr:hypothetical protein E4U49_005190 [Claviceps purpurea]